MTFIRLAKSGMAEGNLFAWAAGEKSADSSLLTREILTAGSTVFGVRAEQ